VHADLVEVERTDYLHKRVVLGLVDELRSVHKAFGQGLHTAKEIHGVEHRKARTPPIVEEHQRTPPSIS
jgi:hypothetical protein